jgi:LmbE family N-acetylglucosaminyl deacetylase
MNEPIELASHAPERRLIEGRGTSERAWSESPVMDGLDTCNVDEWANRYSRIWLLAPHPDDEVLALGGSLAYLSERHADLHIVSVTDGEASHAESLSWTRERLARARPNELLRGLETLGIEAQVHRLRIPDGKVNLHRQHLLTTLAELVDENDLLLTTCRFDGHPDHEACGDVAEMVGAITGATVIEYPVWMWHWARPAESTIPWNRARRIAISDKMVLRKRDAISEFVSQVTPDGEHGAALPPHVLPRFLRPFEIVFA